MKKKYLAIMMGLLLGASLLAGCSGSDTTDDTTTTTTVEESVTTEVTGEITALGENSFTMTTEDGETIEVTVTDDTVLTSLAFGGMGDMQGGRMGSGDMEMPSGDMAEGDFSADEEFSADGEFSAGGEFSADGEVPELPEGDADAMMPEATGDDAMVSEDGTVPEKPEEDSADGTAPTDGTNMEMPDGEAGELGEMPSGEGGDMQMPSGEGGDMQMPEDADLSADEEMPEMGDMEDAASFAGTTITFDDLAVGDTVTVTFDADGNAATVVVGSMETMGEMGDFSAEDRDDAVVTEDADEQK